jgi:hypothetical protein
MTCYCAHCLKPFETAREHEFCTPACCDAQNREERAHKKQRRRVLREQHPAHAGSFAVVNGWQKIAFQNSDDRGRD